MAVPVSRHQQQHSSPHLTRLSTTNFKNSQYRHQNSLSPVLASAEPFEGSSTTDDGPAKLQESQESPASICCPVTPLTTKGPSESQLSKSPNPYPHSPTLELHIQTTSLSRTPSINRPRMSKRPSAALLSHSNSYETSPGSATSSPSYDTIPKMTPLPSPIVRSGSPGPWTRFRSRSFSRPPSRSSLSVLSNGDSVFVTSTGESLSSALAAQSQRRAIAPAGTAATLAPNQINTVRAPALDDFAKFVSQEVPRSIPKKIIAPAVRESNDASATRSNATRPIGTDNLQQATTATENHEPTLHREEYLAKRGNDAISLESSPSVRGDSSSSSTSSIGTAATSYYEERRYARKRQADFEAFTLPDNQKKRWRSIRLLGQGTFSKVMLATLEEAHEDGNHNYVSKSMRNEDGADEGMINGAETGDESTLDPRLLVAVKIVECEAAGGASRDRVESSLKRELDILKSIDHPSLIQLKAFNIQSSRALLVLPYCPGGDLFDIASGHRELLTPSMIRRLFSELLGAVRYLHLNGIVHRDVKLENVLMNLTPAQLASLPSPPFSHPTPLITLTDLGLSRRVDFEHDPLLTTRCGSEDYASPELLMGQPYDGRQTDAWALGVLLYALMEGRLPFDPLPGQEHSHRMRSRTAHRIARCEWRWVNLDPENEGGYYDVEFQGGKEIVNQLLRRANKRVGLDVVEEDSWVKEAIETVPLKRVEEEGVN